MKPFIPGKPEPKYPETDSGSSQDRAESDSQTGRSASESEQNHEQGTSDSESSRKQSGGDSKAGRPESESDSSRKRNGSKSKPNRRLSVTIYDEDLLARAQERFGNVSEARALWDGFVRYCEQHDV